MGGKIWVGKNWWEKIGWKKLGGKKMGGIKSGGENWMEKNAGKISVNVSTYNYVII